MKLRDELILLHERTTELLTLVKSIKEDQKAQNAKIDVLEARFIPVEKHVNFIQMCSKLIVALFTAAGGIVGLIRATKGGK